jgi:hypothetical protein
MTQKIINTLAGIGVYTVATAQGALAQVPSDLNTGINNTQPTGSSNDFFGIFRTVANTLLLIIGILAVIMLIVGGLRYVMSSGNEKAVEGAKNTIFYAIIGLIVAILAFAAVRFIVDRFGGA